MRVLNSLLAAGTLAGCSGATSLVEVPPVPISITDFGAVFDEVRADLPSSDMPAAGMARYTGAVRLDLVDAGATPVGAVAGQLAFGVDFDQALAVGQARDVRVSPVTGTLSDITGQTVDGAVLSWAGGLSTDDPALERSIVSVASSDFSDGMGGVITTRTGILTASLIGDVAVTEGDRSYDATALVLLNGSFVGTGGDGLWGTAQATLVPRGGGTGAPVLGSGVGNVVAQR